MDETRRQELQCQLQLTLRHGGRRLIGTNLLKAFIQTEDGTQETFDGGETTHLDGKRFDECQRLDHCLGLFQEAYQLWKYQFQSRHGQIDKEADVVQRKFDPLLPGRSSMIASQELVHKFEVRWEDFHRGWGGDEIVIKEALDNAAAEVAQV